MNKAGILATLSQHADLLIGPTVLREVVTEGKARGSADAVTLEQLIRYNVQQQPSPRHPRAAQILQSVMLGTGECEALNLSMSVHVDAILSDDRGFLALLFAHQVPYLTPGAVTLVLCDWGILTLQDATHALGLLHPSIRAAQYHAALADLALLERK